MKSKNRSQPLKLIALAIFILAAAPAFNQDIEAIPASGKDAKSIDKILGKFDSTLRQVLMLAKSPDKKGLEAYCYQRRMIDRDGNIAVEVMLEGAGRKAQFLSSLHELGGTEISSLENFVWVEIKPELLAQLGDYDEVRFVSMPQRFYPLAGREKWSFWFELESYIELFLEAFGKGSEQNIETK